jgi:uncharacterized protein involved in tolerance to divalent cations
MIMLYVLSEDASQIENIAHDLLNSRLISSVNIDWNRDRYVAANGKIEKKKLNVMTAVTKALLFETIDSRLRNQYSQNMPEVFSTPIIHIDWDLAKSLIENVEKV